MKKIIYQDETRQKMQQGVNKIATAVGTTLGPRGRNVGIDRGFEKIVVHDGVTVANNFELRDEYEEFGAALVRQAAQHQVEKLGDGTTVTTLLTQSIVNECLKLISSGTNPMALQEGLLKSTKMLVEKLKKQSKPVDTLEDKIHVATIASNDTALGELIGKIIDKVGYDGVVTVEESKSSETVVEHQEGMQFENGWMSPYQVTDPNRMEATIDDPYIVICDKEINNLMEFIPFTKKLLAVTHNIVIIAPGLSNEVLTSAVLTKMQGQANILTVRAPLWAEKQKEFLKDIAILTGGKVVGDELGTSFEHLEVDICGHADRVTSTKDSTLIVGGKGDFDIIQGHLNGLKRQLDEEEGAFNREKLKERIAKLSSGVAVIKVGGATEVEMRDRKEWATDSVASTKSAVEDGIVTGGEIPLLRLSEVPDSEFADSLSARILKEAVKAPFKKLINNAGLDYTETLIKLQGKGVDFGIDVRDGQVKDLMKAGIIDPVSVVTSALENAVSVSLKIMTTDALIVEEKFVPQLIKNIQ